MPRFFVKMAYDGGEFHGWQRQPNSQTVQQTIEEAFTIIYRKEIQIVGCGRTDTGVHASCFYFHVDVEQLGEKELFKLNSILPNSIALYESFHVHDDAHTRFDAVKRSYTYYAHGHYTPFLHLYSSKIIELKKLTIDELNILPEILTNYKEFAPFCKAHGDNRTNKCKVSQCYWTFDESQKQFIFHITSDRFLRGMVRLIVGASILVAKNDLSLKEVETALINQNRLSKNLSAPPQGLFLSNVIYPYLKN